MHIEKLARGSHFYYEDSQNLLQVLESVNPRTHPESRRMLTGHMLNVVELSPVATSLLKRMHEVIDAPRRDGAHARTVQRSLAVPTDIRDAPEDAYYELVGALHVSAVGSVTYLHDPVRDKSRSWAGILSDAQDNAHQCAVDLDAADAINNAEKSSHLLSVAAIYCYLAESVQQNRLWTRNPKRVQTILDDAARLIPDGSGIRRWDNSRWSDLITNR